MQLKRGRTVWRACGYVYSTSNRASTGGEPNGAAGSRSGRRPFVDPNFVYRSAADRPRRDDRLVAFFAAKEVPPRARRGAAARADQPQCVCADRHRAGLPGRHPRRGRQARAAWPGCKAIRPSPRCSGSRQSPARALSRAFLARSLSKAAKCSRGCTRGRCAACLRARGRAKATRWTSIVGRSCTRMGIRRAWLSASRAGGSSRATGR